MRLTRIYVPTPLSSDSQIELPPDTGAHLAKVLRARSGDTLIVFNGNGDEFSAVVETVRGARVSLSLGAGLQVNRESSLKVTLVQCVPRGDRMDFIVQKATELGVARIVSVLSQRSIVRLDDKQSESKATHWRAVAASACEQCGRNLLPEICIPQPLLHYLGASTASGPRLVFEPDSVAQSLPQSPQTEAEIAIGPEGGFAPEELEAFRLSGFLRVHLGPRILRTETAALAALTWLQARLGDMQGY